MINILLIGKNPKNLQNTLSQCGYNTSSVIGGIDSLKDVAYEKFDIIILDVIIPNINGWTTLQKIRKKNDIPIIITTSIKDEEQMVLGLKSGADDYMIKPFMLQNLLARMEAVLRRTKPKIQTTKNNLKQFLTKREFEILEFISKGSKNKEIAEKLYLSEITVKSHVSKILKKLNVSNRTQAVLLYKQN